MEEVFGLLPVLAVAIIMNIAAGMYYNIGVEDYEFDFEYFISGIIKAIIVAGLFIGTAFCFDKTDLTMLGVTPAAIANSAIILYVGKAVISLMKILGVDTSDNYYFDFLDDDDEEDGESEDEPAEKENEN